MEREVNKMFSFMASELEFVSRGLGWSLGQLNASNGLEVFIGKNLAI